MQKITFENSPSTNTPLNASNLNTLQSNVEDAFNNTYGTSQTEGYSQDFINKIGNQITGFGDILITDGTYTGDCYSKVAATYIGNKIWRIETAGRIENNNAGSSYYNWGISITKINTLLNLDLRNYSNTQQVSSYICNDNNGAIKDNINGYGTIFEYKDTLNALLPARYYTRSGTIGGWGFNNLPNQTYIRATIYLKEQ